VLDTQELSPGYAINGRFDIIRWNQAALAVFGDFSLLTPAERTVPRLLLGMLRPLIVNWKPNARFVLGAFTASTCAHVEEPWFKELVEDLIRRYADFRAWWSEYNVELRPVAYKELAHPVVGQMVLEQTAL